jgi:hypothetical protein
MILPPNSDEDEPAWVQEIEEEWEKYEEWMREPDIDLLPEEQSSCKIRKDE